ncbi:hypothetical protein COLO4_06992 [Corchorus olitorius]|uniref:glutathione transferase n=1 Tax=Corchorus olitorius TaxID=93759 RepID=A0A1R3KLC0_9ROSI|nr:hypothetical protein COLO4_06992 [Corchorus olitorius]
MVETRFRSPRLFLNTLKRNGPKIPLLPSDPYERAMARFWIKFADDKGPIIWKIYQKSGEERKKVIEESLEMLKTLEEYGIGDKKFFGGDNIGMVDIAFGGLAYWEELYEKVLDRNLLEADKFPRLYAWIKNFKEVPEIKENLPDLTRLSKLKS